MPEELTKARIDTALDRLSRLVERNPSFAGLVVELDCAPDALREALVRHRLADLRSREAEAIDRSLAADLAKQHEAGERPAAVCAGFDVGQDGRKVTNILVDQPAGETLSARAVAIQAMVSALEEERSVAVQDFATLYQALVETSNELAQTFPFEHIKRARSIVFHALRPHEGCELETPDA